MSTILIKYYAKCSNCCSNAQDDHMDEAADGGPAGKRAAPEDGSVYREAS